MGWTSSRRGVKRFPDILGMCQTLTCAVLVRPGPVRIWERGF